MDKFYAERNARVRAEDARLAAIAEGRLRGESVPADFGQGEDFSAFVEPTKPVTFDFNPRSDVETQTETGPITRSFRALAEDEERAVMAAPHESFITFKPRMAERADIDKAKAMSKNHVEIFDTLSWALHGHTRMNNEKFHDLQVLIEEKETGEQ
jgi:hypothetical protein